MRCLVSEKYTKFVFLIKDIQNVNANLYNMIICKIKVSSYSICL